MSSNLTGPAMATSRLPYVFLFALLLTINLLIFLTPLIAMEGQSIAAEALYAAFSPTCHQLTSRSLCLFRWEDKRISIGSCIEPERLSFSRANRVVYPDRVGYKFPVCARDTAIYAAMLLGLAILPFITRIELEDLPNVWLLVAAALPIGIDGGLQLLGILESTNTVRILTGAIVGLALPFYLLPILNALYSLIKEKLEGEGLLAK
ncbi:MAG: DUF2085 domain-containing protein [Candidatus Micrarchaeota archaeon]|nr:DUF2085 domain-containing protein [Candidatus Micrarchaeota archaeon]